MDTAYETETVTVETKNPAVVPTPAAPVIVPPSASQLPADNNDFVNYTETNANYREFGERTPRDQRIVSAGAGSNMSASIPPTIEEEVSDYEDEINEAMNDDSDNSSSSDSNTASEDPVEDWLAEEGNTLKGLLTDWSERRLEINLEYEPQLYPCRRRNVQRTLCRRQFCLNPFFCSSPPGPGSYIL